MKVVVADTSALVRLYVPDGPLPEGFDADVESAWRSETVILVPEIALAEIAQVLWKKERAGFLDSSEVEEILSAFLELPLEVVGHRKLLVDALPIARAHEMTVYDALFLALAEKKKASLVTADRRLAKAFAGMREP